MPKFISLDPAFTKKHSLLIRLMVYEAELMRGKSQKKSSKR